jgi:hypothetical protein
MVNKDFIFSKIEDLEGVLEGKLIFKNNSIYLDHLNLSWSSNDLLRSYCVPASLINKFNNFYGRIGDEAKTALKKSITLTSDNIKNLFKVSVRISIQEVFQHIGGNLFKSLPDVFQVILVSLWRQFGRLTRPEYPVLAMASRMLMRGHAKLAIRYLKDEKGWSVNNKEFMPQRLKEAEMHLKEGLYPNFIMKNMPKMGNKFIYFSNQSCKNKFNR